MADRRLAVVTGAANGLGRAIAIRLAEDGNRIAAADRDEAGLAALADIVRQAGGEIATWGGDLTDTGRIVAIFGEIREELGPVDILVNNVGGSMRGQAVRFADSDLSSFDQMIGLNLRPTVWASRQVIGEMKQRGWGRIVNITSEAAFRGSERMWDYGAAKGGIVTFTRSLAIEVGRFGVTVNAVGPGQTRTAAYDALPPEVRQASETGIPTGHPGEPEDIAHAVSFFVSEGARQVNGQTLLVNGGTWLN
jgi:acetoacetyl-CoA reductase/3-oxoacyl-[acyl-carrier protein] reductase